MPSGKANKPKLIAEKYSIDYYRRPRATRLWKRRWNYSALGLAAAVFIGVVLFQRQETFQAAPVSSAHAAFGNDCAKCHRQSWQTAMRLLTFGAAHQSVIDNACQDCHHVADHQAGLVPAEHCAACHQEHRSGTDLTAVTERNCVACHGELHSPRGANASFAAAIATFDSGPAGHPEFALLRANDEAVGQRHGARDVAQFVANSGDGKWIDRGGVKFNHAYHLNPQGVKSAGGHAEVLTCASCHSAVEDGRDMRPIVYEQHCQRCHPLRLSEQLSSLGEAPHGSVDEVYGFLRRARLAELNRTGEQAAAVEPQQIDPPNAVRMRLPSTIGLSEAEESKIHQEADWIVFGREAQRMCFHCHQVVVRGDTWAVLNETGEAVDVDKISPASTDRSMVPRRWFQHASFDHRSHSTVECSTCHAASKSDKTTDILLPSINTCRTCHGSELASGRIRADCILCHKYHDAGQGTGVATQEKPRDTFESVAVQDTMP